MFFMISLILCFFIKIPGLSKKLISQSFTLVKLRKKEIFKYSKYVLLRKKNKYSQTDSLKTFNSFYLLL